MLNSANQSLVLKATLLVALSATLYGFLGYLGLAVMAEKLSISTMLFWRFFIAALWMLPFVARKYWKRQSMNGNGSILAFVFFLGALGYAGSSGFFFVASQSIGTGMAMVIFFSYPILLALASFLLYRQKITWSTALVLLIMVVGIYLLCPSDSQGISWNGLFFGFCSAASYAFYMLSSQKFSAAKMDSNLLTMTVSFGAALVFLLISLHDHSFGTPQSFKGWLSLLSLGILATALPIQLMLEGLKTISSLRASIISVLEPLVTVIVGIVLLDESVSGWQSLGGILILISALLIQFIKEENKT